MIRIVLFYLFSILTLNGIYAQNVLFEDSFESYEDFTTSAVGEWTLRDLDSDSTYGFENVFFPGAGSPFAYIVFNASQTVMSQDQGIQAHDGSKFMAAFAPINPPNNDWIISPKIQLAPSGNTLLFYAKSYTAMYGLELFRVHISTSDTEISSFTSITNSSVSVPVEWTPFTFDLDAFANQEVHIAIQCVSNDAFVFMLDSFSVSSSTLATQDFALSEVQVYPNPVQDVLHVHVSNRLDLNRIQVLDVKGGILLDVTNSRELNVAKLSTGIYFIKIETDKGSLQVKFVKK